MQHEPIVPSVSDQRRHDRRKTLLAAKVETAEGLDECVVHDLSRGGAEISSVATLSPNQKVSLVLPRAGKVPARVAWCSERRAGLQFLAEVDPEALIGVQPPTAGPPPETGRAELEARLLETARRLDNRQLEIAIDQMAVLARLRD